MRNAIGYGLSAAVALLALLTVVIYAQWQEAEESYRYADQKADQRQEELNDIHIALYRMERNSEKAVATADMLMSVCREYGVPAKDLVWYERRLREVEAND